MQARNTRPPRNPRLSDAQQRWKRRWSAWLVRSFLAAGALHVGVFALWPQFQVDTSLVRRGEVASVVHLPGTSEMRAPAPPGEIVPPALPAVAELELELPDDLAGPLPVFEDLQTIEIPTPPLASRGDEWEAYQRFAPTMMRPEIRNLAEVRSFLKERYQPILDETGVQGVVNMRFWIDERGEVRRAELARTSGLPSLDGLAQELSRILRFRPARRSGAAIAVQVVVPIEFEEIV